MYSANRFLLALIAAVFTIGCHNGSAPSMNAPMTQPAMGQSQFVDLGKVFTFNYPTSWQPGDATATKFEFTSATASGAHLTMEIPHLPWHPSWMLTVQKVRDGYVEDVKKNVPDAQPTDLPDPTVPDAAQKRVKLTGHVNGKSVVNEAVLIVRNDTVYVLSIDCDESSYPAARAALDVAVGSLRWTK